VAANGGEGAQEQAKVAGEVIARAWSDDAFKARLLANPNEVLAESGMDVPSGVQIRIVENTDTVTYVTLPAPPSEEISDDALEAVAGGSTAGSGGSVGTASSYSCPVSSMSTLGSAGTAGSS
jgi:hypothetical protein